MLLTPTTEKVLNMIYEPDFRTFTQQQTFDYLRRFINQLSTENLGKFLQFVTGTPQCALQHVKVVFNSTGESFARIPVASTCSMSLNLPTSYNSFSIFSAEFQSILANVGF